MKHNNTFYFCLWNGPQYRCAYGISTKQQLCIHWLESLGLCDLKYTNIGDMFREVAQIQNWGDIEGLAMTVVSDELYEDEMRIKGKR